MIPSLLIIIIAGLAKNRINAQLQTQSLFPYSSFDEHSTLEEKNIYRVPPIDLQRVLAADMKEDLDESVSKPFKFGESIPFQLNIKNDGEWTVFPNARVWRAKIKSQNAVSISLHFSKFYLPSQSELYVIGKDNIIGALTGRLNNKSNFLFSTSPIAGDEVILEYWEALDDVVDPISVKRESISVILELESVVHGYKQTMFETGQSGSCHVDVACPEGNKYRDIINSVGMLITDRGQRLCSGAMINNPRQDGRQLYLTANHCVDRIPDTTNFIVGFDYQYTDCVSGNGKIGQESQAPPKMRTVQGMKLLSRWDMSDFALFEIIENIPDSYNVYYAGWNRSPTLPSDVTCIHHPSGDVKKISRYIGETKAYSFAEFPQKYHILIPRWSQGVTERGSSGSPLFDSHGRITGHLHGGLSSCQYTQGYDAFGSLFADWNSGPDDSKKLKQYLDPDNLNVLGMGGNYFTNTKREPSKVALPKGDQ